MLDEVEEVLFARKKNWLKVFVNVLQKEMTLCYFSSSLSGWTKIFNFQ